MSGLPQNFNKYVNYTNKIILQTLYNTMCQVANDGGTRLLPNSRPQICLTKTADNGFISNTEPFTRSVHLSGIFNRFKYFDNHIILNTSKSGITAVLIPQFKTSKIINALEKRLHNTQLTALKKKMIKRMVLDPMFQNLNIPHKQKSVNDIIKILSDIIKLNTSANCGVIYACHNVINSNQTIVNVSIDFGNNSIDLGIFHVVAIKYDNRIVSVNVYNETVIISIRMLSKKKKKSKKTVSKRRQRISTHNLHNLVGKKRKRSRKRSRKTKTKNSNDEPRRKRRKFKH